MHMQRTVVLIVLAVWATLLTAASLVVAAFGQAGGWAVLVLAVVALKAYRLGLGPWHRRWGTRPGEPTTELPDDGRPSSPRPRPG